jgi:hypothetical protein
LKRALLYGKIIKIYFEEKEVKPNGYAWKGYVPCFWLGNYF